MSEFSHNSDYYLESPSNESMFQESDLATIHRSLSTKLGEASESSECIACLVESRGAAGEVGVALFFPSTSQCYLYQISETPAYNLVLNLLTIHPPVHVRDLA